MKLTRESWRQLPVAVRGLVAALLVVIFVGMAAGLLLARYRHRIENLGDVSTCAAHSVWVLAALTFAIVVFRRKS